MNLNHFIAGLIAGIIGFAVNIGAQYFLDGSIKLATAAATGLGLFVVFFIITAKYRH